MKPEELAVFLEEHIKSTDPRTDDGTVMISSIVDLDPKYHVVYGKTMRYETMWRWTHRDKDLESVQDFFLKNARAILATGATKLRIPVRNISLALYAKE